MLSILRKKKRDLVHRIMDTRIWNNLELRESDIVIASWMKSGTTWLQQIVSQIIFEGQENLPVSEMSPWVDTTRVPKEETFKTLDLQRHRRFLKTHAPADALNLYKGLKYIYIVRDGRDVAWSLHNHSVNLDDPNYEKVSKIPKEFFLEWLQGDGYPFWPYWGNIRSWWECRDLPNVLLVHFQNLKDDLPGQIQKIAGFLDVSVSEKVMQKIVEHSNFEYMHAHAEQFMPRGSRSLHGGAKTFIYKGTNNRWKDSLNYSECQEYEQTALRELGSTCAQWLKTGKTTL